RWHAACFRIYSCGGHLKLSGGVRMVVPTSSQIFFVKKVGLSSCLDIYQVAGCERDIQQSEIAACLGNGVPRVARAILGSPRRRLAWHLLEAPPAPPRPADHARALHDVEAQRSIASHLLAEAIGRDMAGVTGPRSTELWSMVDRAWTDLATSSE